MEPGSSSSNPVYNSPSITEDTNEIFSPNHQISMEPGSSSSNPGYHSPSITEDTDHQTVSLMHERLLSAAISGNTTAEIQNLINENPEILLGKTSQGNTCLHISLIFGHMEFSQQVWTRKQSLLSILNSYVETPLIVAVKSGHVSLASNLLKQYERLKLSKMILQQDNNGDSALHHAIRHGHEDLALKLIEVNPNFSKIVNNYNESPMYIAVMRGFDNVFKSLWGTDLSSALGPYDDSALHAAVRNGNLDIIKTIMENRPYLVKAENKSGHTPIQYAVHRNQTEVVKEMLKKDRSLGYLVNKNKGYDPLLIAAACRGYVEVAEEILRHCPDAPYCNGAGLTILHQAVIDEQEEFVEFIMGNGQLDKLINMRDSDGNTALHYAVQKCNPEIVRSLLDHKKIDVRIYDKKGTPAFWRLTEAMDSAKSLNWNEVFMLMSRADPQATKFYVRQVAKNGIKVKSMQEISSLTKTYTTTTSLVAILIATITFAAPFALPGGYSMKDNTEGLPVMARKPAFKAFLISDTLAMCSSLAVAFICILARWEDLKFLLYYKSITNKLMWFALMATTVAFATGLYTVVAPGFLWLAILICILSISLPFLTYLLGYWPMLKLQLRLGSAFKSNLLDMV